MKKKLLYLLFSMLCISFVVNLVGCAGTKTRESTGQYFDSSVTTTKIKAALFQDEALKSLSISVRTYKGTVQLSGFVNSKAQANRAVSIARSIKGVKQVKNNLIIKK